MVRGAICSPEDLAAAKREDAGRGKRIYRVSIPAERGKILDRNGRVLAMSKGTYNLAVSFANLLLSDADAVAYARQQIGLAESLLPQGVIDISDEQILRHYKRWGALPLDIFEDLNSAQLSALQKQNSAGLAIRPVYRRFYPNGPAAAHILGYAGESRSPFNQWRQGDGVLSSDVHESREGLEKSFDDELAGKPGQQVLSFNVQGERVAQETTDAPHPGNDLVTTLDLDLQTHCEKTIAEGASRGAIVIVDCKNGEILAMASWPSFDPNLFAKPISAEKWKSLTNDPDCPLIARAFHAAYPPGSVFKVFSGIAALESGALRLDEKISNPAAVQIGDHTFRDWKDADRGELTIAEALEQNADTWFYQAGMKTGAKPMVDLALKFGFSKKTGIPLPGENAGVIPTDAYMIKNQKKTWDEVSKGWLANLAVGQGVTLVTPIQMAQAMATLAREGVADQIRLAKELRNHDGGVIGEFNQQRRDSLVISPEFIAAIKKAMVGVVNGREGAGHAASVEGVKVAGKTGSAQWVVGGAERKSASWFAGFAPADHPEYAFAAITESDGDAERSDSTAASAVGKVLRHLFKKDATPR